MSWLELCIAVDEESAEAVSEVFSQYGYNGGVAFELALDPTEAGDVENTELLLTESLSPCQGSHALPVILRTYLPLDNRTEEAREHVEHALWHLRQIRPLGNLHTRILEEQDWEQAWKQHYRIQRIGQRTIIVPSWLEYSPAPDDCVLFLDPGMAFGTGLHPTTQLCLRTLERVIQPAEAGHPSQQVLDLGCGSGILSIAAAKLGAARVVALDTDTVAVSVARENVDRNEVAGVVHVAEGSLPLSPTLPDAPPAFDVVVANIIANVLIKLVGDLSSVLAAGGTLISSGILHEREEDVALAFAAAGLHLHERHCEGDWVALLHRPFPK
jgi:ribosomal protein L11 methyltransferase